TGYVHPVGADGSVLDDSIAVTTGTNAFVGPPRASNRIDTGNFSVGVNTSLSHSWTVTGSVAYAFERQHAITEGFVNFSELTAALADPNPATALNPFGVNNNPATLAALSATALYQSMSSLKTVGLTARGATLALPAGDIEATVGAEYRIQSLETNAIFPGTDP